MSSSPPAPLPLSVLDHILALQLSVAWAGEGRCEPARLGWWDTDLVDPLGGGDLLQRLLPRTHAWAGLQAVREAARRVDEAARRKMSQPDTVRTLFHFGFELDERLRERLLQLKREGRPPAAALPGLAPLDAPFSPEAFTTHVGKPGGMDFKVVPLGRQLKGNPPQALDVRASHLAAALIPLAPQYPLPFYRVEG